MRTQFVKMICVFAVAVICFGAADTNTFTQAFNIASAPCEGLTIDGVTYSFSVAGSASLDCYAGTYAGPGMTDNIRFPNIEGTAAGVLHLTFDVPTTTFGFGVAQSTVALPQFVIIDLYRPGSGLLREEVPLTLTQDPMFVGGRFDYSGPAVKSVTIRFSGGGYTRFAVDNVSYFRPPGQAKCAQ
jgi:hypothetical protein